MTSTPGPLDDQHRVVATAAKEELDAAALLEEARMALHHLLTNLARQGVVLPDVVVKQVAEADAALAVWMRANGRHSKELTRWVALAERDEAAR